MSKKNLNKQIPEISCAISIVFEQDVEVDEIVSSLKEMGISEIDVCRPKCEPLVSLDIAIVKNERFWYLDDALTKMFSKINAIEHLKEIVSEYGGAFCIDIVFYQYGTYPALEFIGDNMKKIRFLEADISIDAY